VAPGVSRPWQRRHEQDLRLALREIRLARSTPIKRPADEGRIAKAVGATGYPKKLELLVDGVVDQRSPRMRRSTSCAACRATPSAPIPALADAQTWGKRSYASEPERAAEGDDVYDVYSTVSPGRPERHPLQ
jgi:hypothetical protein